MLELNKVHNLDALIGLPQLNEKSIDCCITSPPYWGLRDYGLPDSEWPEIKYSPMPGLSEIAVEAWCGVLGLEPTPEMFVGHIAHIFRGVYRALKNDGTLWLNFGDSYSSGGNGGHQSGKYFHGHTRRGGDMAGQRKKPPKGLKEKDLIGIPWRVAFALQADGWYLRSDIIWAKPNPMPESVTDRPTKAHEYLFLMSKSAKYYYDAEAIKEPVNGTAHARGNGINPKARTPSGWDTSPGAHNKLTGRYQKVIPERCRASASARMGRGPGWRNKQNESFSGAVKDLVDIRNKRSVWTVATQPFSEAHFTVYPEKLIIPCVLAGCPQGGNILDPFDGAGTTRAVAAEYGRKCISFELNPGYIEISNKRYHERTLQTKLDLQINEGSRA